MAVGLRRLTIDDYESMLHVWGVAGLPIKPRGRESRPMLELELSRDYCAAFGAFDAERMVGVVIANYDGRRGWINRLAVDPDYRGLGLASALMFRCEEFLKQFGEVVICGLVEDPNYPSMQLFENNGYTCEQSITYWTKRPRPDL